MDTGIKQWLSNSSEGVGSHISGCRMGKRQQCNPRGSAAVLARGLVFDLPLAALVSGEYGEPWGPSCKSNLAVPSCGMPLHESGLPSRCKHILRLGKSCRGDPRAPTPSLDDSTAGVSLKSAPLAKAAAKFSFSPPLKGA